MKNYYSAKTIKEITQAVQKNKEALDLLIVKVKDCNLKLKGIQKVTELINDEMVKVQK